MRFSKEQRKPHLFQFQCHVHTYILRTAWKAWLPDCALLAEEQNKQQTDPVSSHTTLGAALDFLLLSAPRLTLPFPPFFASFSETHPSSMDVLSLMLQNCTALSEEQVIYLCWFPALALRDSYSTTGTCFIPPNPETSPVFHAISPSVLAFMV